MALKSSFAVGIREKIIQKSMPKMTDFDSKSLPKMTLKSSCAVGFRGNNIQKSMLKMTDFDPQKPPENDSEIELCRGDS